jgi:negative regulator of sigma E activity
MPEPAVALQISPEPTNKVQAGTTAAGGLAAVIAGVMAAYGGPAVVELLGAWATTHPSATALLVAGLSAVAAYFVTKYGGQAAAYNVLDKPNVAMIPGPKP